MTGVMESGVSSDGWGSSEPSIATSSGTSEIEGSEQQDTFYKVNQIGLWWEKT